jgi:hypothetical protein
MSRDTDAGIVRQHSLEPNAQRGRPVGDDYLPRVQRVADPHTAPVVE